MACSIEPFSSDVEQALGGRRAIEECADKFLPVLLRHEGWPPPRIEEMVNSGEMLQVITALRIFQRKGNLSDDEIRRKIASGEFSAGFALLRGKDKRGQVDLRSILEKSINAGQLRLHSLLTGLAQLLPDDAEGFAVELAAGAGFLSQNIVRRWPGLKMYPTEKLYADDPTIGLNFLRWSLQEYACASPCHGSIQSLGDCGESGDTHCLFDTLWRPHGPPYLSVKQHTVVSRQLLDRAVAVDAMQSDWPGVAHLEGACRLICCTCLMLQVGYHEPLAWQSVLRTAARMVAPCGLILLYDSEEWGGYLEEQTMHRFCEDERLGIRPVLRAAPVKNPGDPHGMLSLMVLQKTAVKNRQQQHRVAFAHCIAASLHKEGSSMMAESKTAGKNKHNVASAHSACVRALDAIAAGGVEDAALAAQLHMEHSATCAALDRWDDALQAADSAIGNDPTCARAHGLRADILESLGRAKDARCSRSHCQVLTATQAIQQHEVLGSSPSGYGVAGPTVASRDNAPVTVLSLDSLD